MTLGIKDFIVRLSISVKDTQHKIIAFHAIKLSVLTLNIVMLYVL
jgi:hypothetical protein